MSAPELKRKPAADLFIRAMRRRGRIRTSKSMKERLNSPRQTTSGQCANAALMSIRAMAKMGRTE